MTSMKILRSAVTFAGIASLVLFTALLVVAVTDFILPGDMTPGTAIAIGVGVVVSCTLVLLSVGGKHGRA